MRQRLITLDLSKSTALFASRGPYEENGYLVIAPFQPELTLSANQKRNRRFLEDLIRVNHAHYPVWGGFNIYDDNELKCKRLILIKAFVILNFPRASSDAYDNSDKLQELGLGFCKKYSQNIFLYKPKKSGNDACLIHSAGYIQKKLNASSMIESANAYYSNLRNLGIFGKRKKEYRFLPGRIYVPDTPDSLSEAYRRYGEAFIKFWDGSPNQKY